MPIGGLGVDRPGRRRRRHGAAVEPQRDQLRRRRRRQLRPVRHLVLIIVGILSLVDLGARRSSASGCRAGEYYALMLFALAGMMLMATATDLLVIFLALEVMSLAVYVLTGIRRDSAQRHRGGVQVLPARRLRQRVLPLRHRVHLRR